MSVYFITGKLGSGKTLCTVGRIQKYLYERKRVATNIDLNLDKLTNRWNNSSWVMRVPDKPSIEDLDAIGLGYDGDYKGEDYNGFLALDECGTWFNSRNWNDKGRQALLNWVIHARKKRWDVGFLVQDMSVVDKQARAMFAEHVVFCKRTDRLKIPFIGAIYSYITDKRLSPPKVHIAYVHYGDNEMAPVVDRWIYTGKDLYDSYDTEQTFVADGSGARRILPPMLTHGYAKTKDEVFWESVRNFKAKGVHFFLMGATLGTALIYASFNLAPNIDEKPVKGNFSCNDSYEYYYGSCSSKVLRYPLPDKFQVKSKRKEISDKNSDKPIEIIEVIETNPLDGVYLTGYSRWDTGFQYFFNKADAVWNPIEFGYTVAWFEDEKAILVKDAQFFYIE